VPVAILGSTLTSVVAAPPVGASPGLQPLRIALDFTANVNYLGIYAAIQNGYFAREGVRAVIVPYAGTPAETLLESGQTDLGLTYPPDIPAYRASGLKYRAVAALTQTNTVALAVLASSPYTSPAQLSGKLYGGFGVQSDPAIITTIFAKLGVEHPSFRQVTLNATAYQALAAKRVAYTSVFGGIDDVTAELQGVKLRTFPISRYLGAAGSFPDDAYVATDHEIATKGDLLRRGLAALAAGYRYAAANPAAAERILLADNRTALAHDARIVQATGDATAPTFVNAAGQWGQMSAADFAGITQILAKAGLFKGKAPPPATADFTDALLAPLPPPGTSGPP